MPFTFNAVKLCVVTIREKAWTHAKDICRVLEYKKGRERDVSKKHVSIKKKKEHKHELEERAAEAHPLEWPKISQPDEHYQCVRDVRGTSFYFQVNSQRQNTSEDIDTMCCFFIFDSNVTCDGN